MKRNRGYTLVETLIAAGLLLFGIAAAAALSLTMVSQEEANARVARAINIQEQAARLYQLGLEPAEIWGANGILPPEDNVVSVEFSSTTGPVANVGNLELSTCRIVYSAGKPMTDPSLTSPAERTNDVVVVRPTIR